MGMGLGPWAVLGPTAETAVAGLAVAAVAAAAAGRPILPQVPAYMPARERIVVLAPAPPGFYR